VIPLLIVAGAAVALTVLAVALNSANDSFSSNPVGATTATPCTPPCQFAGAMQSVTFNSNILVARQKNTVTAPHWTLGQDVTDGAGSQRPAVYLVQGMGSYNVSVQVNVTQAVNCPGSADLTGRLDTLEIRGQLPVAVGMQTASATITAPPPGIAWYKGDMAWGVDVPGCGSFTLGTTRVEIFFVLDTPIPVYQSGVGVWVEALRLLCQQAAVLGLTVKRDAAAAVARFCHSGHGLRYDTHNGAPSYGVSGSGGSFDLDRYIQRAASSCNCYDQAAAVQSLSGALGVGTGWDYLEPFGYLKTTDLVGVGQCNNPFFDSNGSQPVVGANDASRTSFGNHAFCQYQAPASGGGTAPAAQVLDACAGPHLATESGGQYCTAGIDSETDTQKYQTDRDSMVNNWIASNSGAPPDVIANVRAAAAAHWHPGTGADIQSKAGVTGVQ
jgi:hypothetical protein